MKFKTRVIILVTSDNLHCFKKQLYNGCSKILLIITTGDCTMNFILHKLMFFISAQIFGNIFIHYILKKLLNNIINCNYCFVGTTYRVSKIETHYSKLLLWLGYWLQRAKKWDLCTEQAYILFFEGIWKIENFFEICDFSLFRCGGVLWSSENDWLQFQNASNKQNVRPNHEKKSHQNF